MNNMNKTINLSCSRIWHDPRERLPALREWVFVVLRNKSEWKAQFTGSGWAGIGAALHEVIAWRPLEIEAWHFLPADGCISREYNSPHAGQRVIPGLELQHEGVVVPEKSGLHASLTVLEAAFWAPSLLLCRVALSGTVVEGDRKVAASRRRVLWMTDATRPFWIWALERAHAAIESEKRAGRDVDPVFVAAWHARRDWLAGRIGYDEMMASRGKARNLG